MTRPVAIAVYNFADQTGQFRTSENGQQTLSRAVKVVLDRVFPLEQAAEAHRYLEAGAHIGKVILKVP